MTDAQEVSRLVETIPELDGVTGMTAMASGGFSRIYKAFQPALNRTVAIKIVDSGGIDPRTRERFDREMGMTGMLGEHPHIVDVYHHGLTHTGEPFLMMRWYEGGSLADGLRESGPMPTAVLLPFAVKVTSALAYVHRNQLLHRDIKPGNILLTTLNEPVLADFGIAVAADRASTATVAWTPVHAAPEILAYEEPTPRSDVWSLGSTLYAALAGRPPYPVDPGNPLASIQQRFRAAPPPFVRTDVPHSLTDLLADALAPSPDDRPDARELIAELQRIERELGLPVTTAPGVITEPSPPVRTGPADPMAFPPEPPGGAEDASTLVPRTADPHGGRSRLSSVAPVQDEGGREGKDPFLVRPELTGVPDAATVLGTDAPSRKDRKSGRSWKKRLLTATAGGFVSLVIALVALAYFAPRDQKDAETPSATPSFVAPVVSGLRRTDSSPTSLTIAWHTQGAYRYAHRVVIEGGKTIWLKDDEVKAGSAVLTGLEPHTRYCLTVDAYYQAASSTASADAGPEYAISSSERKCFRTRK